MAAACFDRAMEIYESIEKRFESPNPAEVSERKLALFSVHSWRAEMVHGTAAFPLTSSELGVGQRIGIVQLRCESC